LVEKAIVQKPLKVFLPLDEKVPGEQQQLGLPLFLTAAADYPLKRPLHPLEMLVKLKNTVNFTNILQEAFLDKIH
jgi:hypothetical protein